jgi:hypothetical protein
VRRGMSVASSELHTIPSFGERFLVLKKFVITQKPVGLHQVGR